MVERLWDCPWLSTVVVGLTAMVVTSMGCTVSSQSECGSDQDCASDEYCLEGGGMMVRDGICVARDAGEAADVDTCPDGETDCQGVCVDVDTDIDHCGQCNRSCSTEVSGADPVCEDGRCNPECIVDEQTLCLDFAICTDLDSDDEHCGDCGRSCDDTETCDGGECVCDEACCVDDDCPHEMLCQDNSCMCIGDSNCAEGDVCEPGDQVCVDCLDDEQCPEHEYCESGDCRRLAPFVYTASGDNTVRKIDAAGDEVWSYDEHDDVVRDVAVDPDKNVYSASDDGTVHKINADGSDEWIFDEHDDAVRGIDVDTDGHIYSASDDGTVRKIDADGTGQWTSQELTGSLNSVEVGTDGRIFAGDSLGSVYRLSSDGSNVFDFDVSMAVDAVAAGDDDLFIGQSLALRSIDTGGDENWQRNTNTRVRDVAVDDQQQVWFAPGEDLVRRVDTDNSNPWQFDDGANARSVAVDPEGNAYFGEIVSGEHRLQRVDANGEPAWSFDDHQDIIHAVAVDPGRYPMFSEHW